MNFSRKVQVQALDTFPSQSLLSEVDDYVRSQRVPGELVISYPGNGGRTSVTFRSKPVLHHGEIEAEPTKP